MKGFGPLGHGGSFPSSSNLSQLAPRFAIDPSYPKPNQLGHFAEPQFSEPSHYTFASRSSHDNWHQFRPPTSRPNSFDYSHPGIDPICGMVLPYASPYRQPNPNFLMPQYPSAAMHENSSLMAINEPGFDMFSASRVAHLAPGNGFRNGMNSGGVGSSTYNGSLNQDLGIAAIQSHMRGIEPLHESNYEKWKSQVDIVLGHLEYDVALLEPKPNEPDHAAPESVKANYQKWIKANRMCIMIIRGLISEIIRLGIPETDSAKELMDIIKTQFVGSTKSQISTTLSKLCSLKFNGQESVRDHILKMVNLVYRLKDLKMELNDDFLIHMVLISLPSIYDAFKANYISIEQKWNVNELINECVQEEARLRQAKVDITHVKTLGVQAKVFKKSEKKELRANKKVLAAKIEEEAICFFCKESGHMKRNCIKFKNLSENKKGFSKPTNA